MVYFLYFTSISLNISINDCFALLTVLSAIHVKTCWYVAPAS